MVSALAAVASNAITSTVIVLRIGLLRVLPSLPATNAKRLHKAAQRRLVRRSRSAKAEAIHVSASGGMDCFAALAMTMRLLLARYLLLAVGDAIDGAVPVVGDQERAILHWQHIDRAADILVVFEEAGDERLHRLHRAVLVQFDDNDVTANLLRPVPGAVPRHDDRVLVGLREHAVGVEAHAQCGGMRAQ